MRTIYARLAKLEEQQRNNRPQEPAPPGWKMIGQGLLIPWPRLSESEWLAECRNIRT